MLAQIAWPCPRALPSPKRHSPEIPPQGVWRPATCAPPRAVKGKRFYLSSASIGAGSITRRPKRRLSPLRRFPQRPSRNHGAAKLNIERGHGLQCRSCALANLELHGVVNHKLAWSFHTRKCSPNVPHQGNSVDGDNQNHTTNRTRNTSHEISQCWPTRPAVAALAFS